MYNDDIRRKKWQKGKFGIPFDMVPLENDTNFYSSFFIFLVLSPFLFFIYEYYIKRGMIE